MKRLLAFAVLAGLLVAVPAHAERHRAHAGGDGRRATASGKSPGFAAVSVTYKPLPPCKVPRLRGQTLSAAKRALRHAGCGLGRGRSARSRSVRKARVISSRAGRACAASARH
jgi:hypothetical protein